MASLSERRGTNCTDAEWDEILEMSIVSLNETPTDWMERIWERLTYFRENDLLPYNSKKYLEARKIITYWPRLMDFGKTMHLKLELPSASLVVYTGKRTI